jgi:hypothetical protein
MKGILLSTFALLLLTGNACAIGTGSDLLSACEAFERDAEVFDGHVRMGTSWDSYVCFGFMNAVQQFSGLKSSDQGLPICVPPGAGDLVQLIRVFTNYARAHPEQLHLQGAELAIRALEVCLPVPLMGEKDSQL